MPDKTMDDSYHRTDEESPEELSSERVIVDVLQAVADEKDVDLVDLPPLAERIDSDAFRWLINHGDDPLPGLEIRFDYAGRTVIIRDDDVIVNSEE